MGILRQEPSKSFKKIPLIGHKVKFWLKSNPTMTFMGDCVSIFKADRGYYLGINFEGDEIVGVRIDDLDRVEKLKRIMENFTVVDIRDQRKENIDGSKNRS